MVQIAIRNQNHYLMQHQPNKFGNMDHRDLRNTAVSGGQNQLTALVDQQKETIKILVTGSPQEWRTRRQENNKEHRYV